MFVKLLTILALVAHVLSFRGAPRVVQRMSALRMSTATVAATETILVRSQCPGRVPTTSTSPAKPFLTSTMHFN